MYHSEVNNDLVGRSVRVMESSISGSILLSECVTPSRCVSSCHHDLRATNNLPTWEQKLNVFLCLYHSTQIRSSPSNWESHGCFCLPWTVASSLANANGGGQKNKPGVASTPGRNTHLCLSSSVFKSSLFSLEDTEDKNKRKRPWPELDVT